MDFFGLLWIFFIISSLQPIIRQKILEMERMRLLERLERSRKSRVIALIHRQETMSFLGFPLVRYINIGADRLCVVETSCQGDCLCPALRDVGRHLDRAGGRRDRDERECRPGAG